jgi:signal transduction histidine kinase
MERRAIRDLAHEAEMQIQELEHLARKLISSQEEQKQTISRELHDNVAQVLSVVTNRISLARGTSRIPAWLRQELNDMQESINTALTDIRILARELRPSLLDHCGFAATLDKHAQEFRDRTGMNFELQIDPKAAESLDTSNLTHLFRLVQEAVQNIEEHSRAERAWLVLAQNDGTMHLEIGDNGCAFTPQRVAEAQADGHLGLLGMRERAELLGGSFQLEATPGKGTTIRVSVPVPPPPAKSPDTHL